jgi:hypothetical protein
MTKTARAGAMALVTAPLLSLIANLILPTLSDDASAKVSALTAHHSSMIVGMTLQTLAIAVMVGGVVWLAATLLQRAPRLALAGGVLGVAGALIVLFEDGISATAPSIVNAIDGTQATAMLDQIHSSGAVALEPLSLMLFLGLVLLGFAVVKAGAPRWVAVVVALGAVGAGIGLPSGARTLAVAGFAMLSVGLGAVVRALAGSPAWQPRPEAVPVH